MGKANGSAGRFYNPIQIGAIKRGTVWIALLTICPHSTGVFELSLGHLADVVAAIRETTNRPSRSKLMADLQRLCDEDAIKLYQTHGELVVWIKDRWSYNNSRSLAKHRASARSRLEHWPYVMADFIAYDPSYDITHVTPVPKAGEKIDDRDIESSLRSDSCDAIPPDTTQAERLVLAEMENWQTCKSTYQQKLTQIRKMSVKYPKLDLLDVAGKLTVWDSEQPKSKRTKNWLSRFTTFCENAEERRKRAPIFPGSNGPDRTLTREEVESE